MEVTVASSSTLAAAAGARVADLGGNAVDTAIAASIVSMVTEPGVCSLGGGAYVTVWPTHGLPVVIDGNVEMPGRTAEPSRFGGGTFDVEMDYGGGLVTTVGHGSVATPGALAALDLAWRRYGSVPWRELIEPAFEHARDGFPLPWTSWYYLTFAHEAVYGWNPESRSALHADDGELIGEGATVRVAGLADSLRLIADEGADVLYRGDLAAAIADDMDRNGGLITAADLLAYEPVPRPPLQGDVGGWRLATNPPPAVGGVTLLALLLLMEGHLADGWTDAAVERLVRTQAAVLTYRRTELDVASRVDGPAERLLDLARGGDLDGLPTSPATVHTSAVDSEGAGCAITASAGYGSGVMPPGTGLWLNNCLGELELNPSGVHGLRPGTRLRSNMAPTVARSDDGATLAIGSPGADRITTAIAQTVLNLVHLGLDLADAIAWPRLHVELVDDGVRIAHEPGIALPDLGIPTRPFDELAMYFGGVAAVRRDADGTLTGATDPRRRGAVGRGGASAAGG